MKKRVDGGDHWRASRAARSGRVVRAASRTPRSGARPALGRFCFGLWAGWKKTEGGKAGLRQSGSALGAAVYVGLSAKLRGAIVAALGEHGAGFLGCVGLAALDFSGTLFEELVDGFAVAEEPVFWASRRSRAR